MANNKGTTKQRLERIENLLSGRIIHELKFHRILLIIILGGLIGFAFAIIQKFFMG